MDDPERDQLRQLVHDLWAAWNDQTIELHALLADQGAAPDLPTLDLSDEQRRLLNQCVRWAHGMEGDGPTDTATPTNPSPSYRAVAAHQRLQLIAATTDRLAAERRAAMGELLDQGHNQSEIAELLGVSRSRISQILKDPPPEDPN